MKAVMSQVNFVNCDKNENAKQRHNQIVIILRTYIPICPTPPHERQFSVLTGRDMSEKHASFHTLKSVLQSTLDGSTLGTYNAMQSQENRTHGGFATSPPQMPLLLTSSSFHPA
jgi:hypothetical protein